MATEFCQKCKQAHPGRACDYDDRGECAETLNVDEMPESSAETPRDPKSSCQIAEEVLPPLFPRR
jgi:hypothetical protein